MVLPLLLIRCSAGISRKMEDKTFSPLFCRGLRNVSVFLSLSAALLLFVISAFHKFATQQHRVQTASGCLSCAAAALRGCQAFFLALANAKRCEWLLQRLQQQYYVVCAICPVGASCLHEVSQRKIASSWRETEIVATFRLYFNRPSIRTVMSRTVQLHAPSLKGSRSTFHCGGAECDAPGFYPDALNRCRARPWVLSWLRRLASHTERQHVSPPSLPSKYQSMVQTFLLVRGIFIRPTRLKTTLTAARACIHSPRVNKTTCAFPSDPSTRDVKGAMPGDRDWSRERSD